MHGLHCHFMLSDSFIIFEVCRHLQPVWKELAQVKKVLHMILAAQVTMLLVLNNALQGILSSFFFKYADTILKKYSSTVATIFTGIMSAALFGHSLTLNFVIGVTIVFISMHQFFAQGTARSSAVSPVLLCSACSSSLPYLRVVGRRIGMLVFID